MPFKIHKLVSSKLFSSSKRECSPNRSYDIRSELYADSAASDGLSENNNGNAAAPRGGMVFMRRLGTDSYIRADESVGIPSDAFTNSSYCAERAPHYGQVDMPPLRAGDFRAPHDHQHDARSDSSGGRASSDDAAQTDSGIGGETAPPAPPKHRQSYLQPVAPSDEESDGDGEHASSPLERAHLSKVTDALFGQLKALVDHTEHFHRAVVGETKQPRMLLREIETLMRPSAIKLDVQLSRAADKLRANVDRCKITDNRVTWLLEYNKCYLHMRRVFDELSGEAFDSLERVLSVRARGCAGVAPRSGVSAQLDDMRRTLDTVHSTLAALRLRVPAGRESPDRVTLHTLLRPYYGGNVACASAPPTFKIYFCS